MVVDWRRGNKHQALWQDHDAESKEQSRESQLEMAGIFRCSKPVSSDTLPPNKATNSTSSNCSTSWGLSIQIYELSIWGTFLLKATQAECE